MPKIIQENCRVLYNKKVGQDYFKMAVYAPEIVQQASPGQFVHLRCQNSVEPLLRRPFSFHHLNKDNFEILYKVIGQGTKLLSKKKKGDTIDILGPLGNGFNSLGTTNSELRTPILVAGGMGVAPLLALAEKLADRKKILVLIGAKTKQAVLSVPDFEELGVQVQVATDDGSKGYKGIVTNLLKKVLKPSTIDHRLSTIYTCGPKPMLKAIADTSRKLRISAYGSLEEKMACGLGACLGCAIKTKTGYKRVCKDGPIFNLGEIVW